MLGFGNRFTGGEGQLAARLAGIYSEVIQVKCR